MTAVAYALRKAAFLRVIVTLSSMHARSSKHRNHKSWSWYFKAIVIENSYNAEKSFLEESAMYELQAPPLLI